MILVPMEGLKEGIRALRQECVFFLEIVKDWHPLLMWICLVVAIWLIRV